MPPAEQPYAGNIELKLELAKLRAQIEWYKRKLLGGGQSEKMDRAQMLLDLSGLESAVQKATELETITYQREKNTAQTKCERDREAFGKLPVTETIIIEPEKVKADPPPMKKSARNARWSWTSPRPSSSSANTFAPNTTAKQTAPNRLSLRPPRRARCPAATLPPDSPPV
jgi:hypothetical protein